MVSRSTAWIPGSGARKAGIQGREGGKQPESALPKSGEIGRLQQQASSRDGSLHKAA